MGDSRDADSRREHRPIHEGVGKVVLLGADFQRSLEDIFRCSFSSPRSFVADVALLAQPRDILQFSSNDVALASLLQNMDFDRDAR